MPRTHPEPAGIADSARPNPPAIRPPEPQAWPWPRWCFQRDAVASHFWWDRKERNSRRQLLQPVAAAPSGWKIVPPHCGSGPPARPFLGAFRTGGGPGRNANYFLYSICTSPAQPPRANGRIIGEERANASNYLCLFGFPNRKSPLGRVTIRLWNSRFPNNRTPKMGKSYRVVEKGVDCEGRCITMSWPAKPLRRWYLSTRRA